MRGEQRFKESSDKQSITLESSSSEFEGPHFGLK